MSGVPENTGTALFFSQIGHRVGKIPSWRGRENLFVSRQHRSAMALRCHIVGCKMTNLPTRSCILCRASFQKRKSSSFHERCTMNTSYVVSTCKYMLSTCVNAHLNLLHCLRQRSRLLSSPGEFVMTMRYLPSLCGLFVEICTCTRELRVSDFKFSIIDCRTRRRVGVRRAFRLRGDLRGAIPPGVPPCAWDDGRHAPRQAHAAARDIHHRHRRAHAPEDLVVHVAGALVLLHDRRVHVLYAGAPPVSVHTREKRRMRALWHRAIDVSVSPRTRSWLPSSCTT